MDVAQIEAMFSQDGHYRFARWGRPIAPVVFGVEDATLSVVKGALSAVVNLSGHEIAETDPELGANLMVFFFQDWDELLAVPDLDRLIPELARLVPRLQGEGASQYRLFRFDDQGAIRACFVFLNMGGALGARPAEEIALTQAVQAMLLWSADAFASQSALAEAEGRLVLRPEIGSVLIAAYDATMPAAAKDPSHALRLAARIGGAS